eukprot:TRINITY_DN6640_c0_g1_i1.p1 TRINITY_DN6640_c0_g1~~TRINITY_DN6640_c0_g1_i1.p1  ORF type:complete len:186 (-),score=26.46 TRINITY_DN6640_c0_g1_i1:26-583(-)
MQHASFFMMGTCRNGEDCNFRHDVKIDEEESPVVRSSTIPCRFFAQGNCLKGDYCNFSHQKEEIDVESDTQEKQVPPEQLTCSICLENIVETKRKYGLLSDCTHVFCLDCIREWRKQEDSSAVKHCPLCRKESHYVVPSTFFASGELKERIIAQYRTQLRQIPCKYFMKLRECPFSDNCFYSHGH